MKKYSTIKIIKDDKYFENKEVKEQLKKLKYFIKNINTIKGNNGKM